MIAATLAVIVFLLLMPGELAAHRLDEYLQAARVSLGRDRVALEIDLTPGVYVADGIVAMLDRDGDGVISPGEARAYGETVVNDLVLALDGRPVALALAHVEISPIGELRAGLGTIAVRAHAMDGARNAGRHHLRLRNDHQPGASVYLTNALRPDDPAFEVVAQTRDYRQRTLEVDYDVRSQGWLPFWWVLVGAMLLTARIAAPNWVRRG